jgi:hypothetical protein
MTSVGKIRATLGHQDTDAYLEIGPANVEMAQRLAHFPWILGCVALGLRQASNLIAMACACKR